MATAVGTPQRCGQKGAAEGVRGPWVRERRTLKAGTTQGSARHLPCGLQVPVPGKGSGCSLPLKILATLRRGGCWVLGLLCWAGLFCALQSGAIKLDGLRHWLALVLSPLGYPLYQSGAHSPGAQHLPEQGAFYKFMENQN